MKNKYKIALTLIAICMSLTFLLGTSYAVWVTNRVSEAENQLVVGCFRMEFSYEDVINLENDYPMSDTDGLNKTPYKMTVKNTCNIAAKLNIVMNVLNSENPMDASKMKVAMSGDKTLEPTVIGLLTETTPIGRNASNARIAYNLGSDHLEPDETKVYEFRLWIDEIAGNEVMNQTFETDIVIQAAATKSELAQEIVFGTDNSGAEAPELDNGMIPVVYKDNPWEKQWVKADTSSKWYDYDNQIWANAVTVSAETRETYINAAANTPINMDDIETMWVWIPRYEYQHTNLSTQYAGGTKALPGGITINFISKETITPSSDNFIIHDAFKWDNSQLSGIWVAKFEMSTGATKCALTTDETESESESESESGSTSECDIITINPQIKPNVTSWRGARIGTYWTAVHNNMNGENNIYGLSNSDTHLMKNMEWGAVAYLSQSKYGKYGNPNYTGANKEIYQNKSQEYITGSSNGTPSVANTQRNTQSTYNIEEKGTGASTTGNIYGIYDMSGGASEYVMGVQAVADSDPLEPMVGNTTSSNSGWSGKIYDSKNWTDYEGTEGYGYLKNIDSKYYDLYTFNTSATAAGNTEARAHKGDATFETKAWYSDNAFFVGAGYAFFIRGGAQSFTTNAGVFFSNRNSGAAYATRSGRPVVVQAS